MAQHDYVIANGTGAAVRSDLNNALAAIVSQNSGATAPATTYAFQFWADTTTGLLKLRNSANSAWITLFQLDGEWSTLPVENGTAAAPSIYFKDSGTDTGFYSPGTNQIGISTAGTSRLTIDANGNLAVDTNTLYVDAPNNRVGIGTSAPSSLLHLQTTSANVVMQMLENNGSTVYGASIDAFNSSGGNIRVRLHDSGGTYQERLRITSAGNVGIGTTSPSTQLHILKSTANAEFQVESTFAGGDARLNLYANSSGVSQIRFGDESSANVGLLTYEHTSDSLAFRTNGSERARIDSSGRLLLGTSSSTSTAPLVVQGYVGVSAGAGEIAITRGGTPSAADQGLGQIRFQNNNGNTGAAIEGISDGSWTAGSNHRSRLVFSVTADGASSPTERMRISNAGGVFINGATSATSGNPNDGFHVGSNGSHLGGDAVTIGDGVATARWRMATGSYNCRFLQNNGSGTYLERSYITNSTGAYVAVSDQRAKKDIIDASYGIDELKQLRPVSYLMKDQDETTARRNLGFIAQEVLGVVPEAVNVPADPEQMYGLESSALIPVLVSSLQEAIAKIETLEAKVAALESA